MSTQDLITFDANEFSECRADNSDPPAYESIPIRTKRFRAKDFVKDGKTHFLIAAVGSLATDIVEKVIDEHRNDDRVVFRVVLSTISVKFISAADLLEKPNVQAVYTDDDWTEHQRDTPNTFLNYELRTWLDYMLVAPCSANTISAMVNGRADDLTTSIIQIFDADGKLNPHGRVGRFKYLSIAPAMDSASWQNPVIKANMSTLRENFNYKRTFASGAKETVSWAVVVLKLGDDESAPFDHVEDNCNMQLSLVMEEVRWELEKFWPKHRYYTPGI